jgi:hypothetical protein
MLFKSISAENILRSAIFENSHWVIVLILLAPKISAQNTFNSNWDIGNIGVGMNYSSNDDDSIEITVSVLNLVMEHYYSNVGFEFSPFKY